MENTEFRETTTPLLRPQERVRLEEEQKRLHETLSAPPHIAGQISDRPAMYRAYQNLSRKLETQSPKPYGPQEKDKAIRRAAALEARFTAGMPTAAEMRRGPPGAVDKHMAWERRNKKAILEWKNIQQRLHVGGDAGDSYSAVDISNVERFRPTGGGITELSMDNAAIPGTQYHIPPRLEIRNVMSDEDRARVAAENEEMREHFPSRSEPVARPVAKKRKRGRPKRNLTPEQRAEIGRRLHEAKAAKAAAAEAGESQVEI